MPDGGKYRVSESSLSAMLQSIPAHISIIDPDLNIVWANHIAKNKFGNDLAGRKCFQAYHGRSSPCEPSPCLTIRAFRDGMLHEHAAVVDNRGKRVYFLRTANVAMRDPDGTPIRVIVISRNISKLKHKDQLIQNLKRLLPICAGCKMIRDNNGHWHQVEKYIQDHSGTQFSHSICPACVKVLYPDFIPGRTFMKSQSPAGACSDDTQQITIYLPCRLAERVNKYAKENGNSMTGVVIEALDFLLRSRKVV